MQRFTGWLELSPEELEFLEALERQCVTYPRGATIAVEGDASEFAFVVRQGWLGTSTDLPDGSRQMRRLHLPGDIVGFPSLAMRHHAENIVALTDVIVCPFGKPLLWQMFALPRISAVMFMVAQAERIALGDRLSAIGRRSSKARVAFLLLDLLYRLRAVDPSVGLSFALPLTRDEIGDMTGMTAVHVSRKWSELRREKLVDKVGPRVKVLDEERLVAISGYVNRMRDLDLRCLPRVRVTPQA